MAEKQQSLIKFCVLNRLLKKEIMLMLKKTYGDKAMKKTTIYKWYGRILDGQESILDEKLSGSPKIVQCQIMSR